MRLLEEIRHIKSDKKTLKHFGFAMATCFGVLAVFFLLKQKSAAVYLVSLSMFFLIFGIMKPEWLLPIQKIWMTLAFLMGWVMTRVILSVLFYVCLTPISLLSRLMGKSFLQMKLEVDRESYWEKHKVDIQNKSRYENQF